MVQINIRIDKELDETLEYLSSRRKVSKSKIAEEFLKEGFTEKILPILLEEYKKGEIGLKNIIRFTNLTPRALIDKIAELEIEPPIPKYVDNYTEEIVKKLVKITQSKENEK